MRAVAGEILCQYISWLAKKVLFVLTEPLCKYVITYMKKRTRKPQQERKAEIIEATLSLSAEVGPDQTTTEAIAQRIGLSQSAIFRHFPTKTDIWNAVFAKLSNQMEQGWGDAKGEKSAQQRIQSVVLLQLRLVNSVPALPSIVFSRELHRGNTVLRMGVMALMKRFRETLKTHIASGIASGEFCDDLDPQDAALLVISTLQGIVMRWSLSGEAFDLID
ncbi:MAG: TetR/AcrR family transcriptional regulator, partial [Rhodospirillaceae bacterium]|nr:TetR/AcrR family transcriptional regulator [Rhodospirillaceae bacterium]